LIDREKELEELNLLAVSGRRWLGKTTLLLEWARRSGQPYLYWVASRAPESLLLRQFRRPSGVKTTPMTSCRPAFPLTIGPAPLSSGVPGRQPPDHPSSASKKGGENGSETTE